MTGLKWKIVGALGLSPGLLAFGCVDRSIVADSVGGSAEESGSTGDDGDGSSEDEGSTTSPLPSTTMPTTTPMTSTSTTDPSTTDPSTSEGSSSGVPPPVCVPSDAWEQIHFCMPPGPSGECACDEACQQYADQVWFEERCCDSCEYVFSNVLCAELWDDQCCYVAEYVIDWCGKGRPFAVGSEIRTAAAVRREDWCGDVDAPSPALDDASRRVLAQAWIDVALAEHASVASFARFVLELVAVGAPADLIADASSAMRDEVRHAEVAFAFASSVGGEPCGPGPLPMQGVLARSDLEAIVRAAVREGCIGETLSAAEVELASVRAREPAVADALATIAEDEARHAVLAWRFVQWAVRERPELAAMVRRELERAVAAAPSSPADALPPAMAEAHGHLAAHTREGLRAHMLRHVVLPCAEAMLRDADGLRLSALRAAGGSRGR